jgi:hypothetical protein
MAKSYDVRHAFQSPSLGKWICRDTAHLVPKLSEKELAHALKNGLIVETTGMPAVAQDEAATAAPSERAKGGR